MTTELMRLVRHGLTPLVAIAVKSGVLPEAAQGPVTEFLIILFFFIISVAWSFLYDVRKKIPGLLGGESSDTDPTGFAHVDSVYEKAGSPARQRRTRGSQ